MASRCANAEPVAAVMLPNFRLEFRGAVTITPEEGAETPAAIYHLPPEDAPYLERFEQVPNAYYRIGMTLKINGKEEAVYTYFMKEYDIGTPPPKYVETIREGYKDWGLDESFLDQAVAYATENDSGNGFYPERWGKKGDMT